MYYRRPKPGESVAALSNSALYNRDWDTRDFSGVVTQILRYGIFAVVAVAAITALVLSSIAVIRTQDPVPVVQQSDFFTIGLEVPTNTTTTLYNWYYQVSTGTVWLYVPVASAEAIARLLGTTVNFPSPIDPRYLLQVRANHTSITATGVWLPINAVQTGSIFVARYSGLTPWTVSGGNWVLSNNNQSNAVQAAPAVRTWGNFPNTTVSIVRGSVTQSDGFVSDVPIKYVRLYVNIQFSSQSTPGRIRANLFVNGTNVNTAWMNVPGSSNNVRSMASLEWTNVAKNSVIECRLDGTIAGTPTNAGIYFIFETASSLDTFTFDQSALQLVNDFGEEELSL